MDEKKAMERASHHLKAYGQKTMSVLLTALLIWLFGVLVFIPLAESLNWQTRVLVSLTFLMAFSLMLFKTIPGVKRLVDAFSLFPAKKYGIAKGFSYENAVTLFRYAIYIVCSLILYGLYLPFLVSFHPAISGMTLILVLTLMFFLLLRIFSILLPKLAEWLVKS
jgi:hypothetical protein